MEMDEGVRQYWVGLKNGWYVRGDTANHTIHEESLRAVFAQFYPEPCECSEPCRVAIAAAAKGA